METRPIAHSRVFDPPPLETEAPVQMAEVLRDLIDYWGWGKTIFLLILMLVWLLLLRFGNAAIDWWWRQPKAKKK
ncbi:uncharacterized protein N7469_008294 [Penicillium citrinum]|uniref:Uncharacterized protein n=1 Tax=Penicillium citrinum TaxID=5077 RepID=A0A9W9NRF5_PENCI|nr:uncharacterized protein N7469_008294 [Penicillium citrinum]KAJ5224791.1 hypothetical protein N7469_008294 [Penicillium citrinum]